MEKDATIAMYDAVDRKKLRDIISICTYSRIGCLCLAAGLTFVAALLPLLVPEVTKLTVWLCMGLEALALLAYEFGNYIRTILNRAWHF